jgi:lysophosphatidylcholine acyltransferase/lyso-PAF acetyltransferase
VLAIAPHHTFIDPFVMNILYPPLLSGVGKKDLLDMPMLGRLGLATQGIYVDRKKPESRKACAEAISRQARQDWKGPPLVIFPEGTTLNGKALTDFKVGAFLPGEPVQPVLLRYPYKHYNPSWVGLNSNLALAILRCMLQFANHCEITLLDPHFPSDEEKQDAKLFANNVRSVMAKELGVETTEHSYDDLFFSMDAMKAKARIEQDFEISAVKSKYDLDSDQLKRFLTQFQKLDTDRSGNLSYEQFAMALRNGNAGIYSEEAAIDHLFTFFDTDGTGDISYLRTR